MTFQVEPANEAALAASAQAGGKVLALQLELLGFQALPELLERSRSRPSGGSILPPPNCPRGLGCCQYFALESGWSPVKAAVFELRRRQHFLLWLQRFLSPARIPHELEQ